ncbi:DNA-binding winged helix-turn-helix (wHTH) protein [Streptosporangium becharense]|uniref:DNA-binding winged helix-turn-helix (WHTH) protein n=1 Tax=Streptosporangium becharense TaxID=1816182 RepID=A0A7W9IHB8_9ACTN|nr:DNA-binding winged helix-turn-helix (wHTH) protein [Streptosporangium becharense]MBB5820296.1 DNA-binding winged helix-turn-helix (wHTH) protein [Streptosporangium becharense]
MDDPPPLRVDLRACRVWQGQEELSLTLLEFRLLALLVDHAGVVVTREQIMHEVWGTGWRPSKTLDMHISWLRRKLSDDATWPTYITTVRGIGFRFDGAAEVVGYPASPASAGDALALARAVLAELRALADSAQARLAELERAHTEEVTSSA